MTENVANVVHRLLQEPLTHLMLGHRELFHSNLLAWFFEDSSLRDAADRVFLPLTRENPAMDAPRAVVREGGNLDIQFTWPGRERLVIENKVFSLPDEKQLARYTQELRSDEPVSLWLLSAADPGWPSGQKEIGGRVWKWLSYGRLAEAIRGALPGGPSSYAIDTMRHYATVAELLDALVRSVVPRDAQEAVSLSAAVQSAVESSRFGSVVAKLRADGIAQWMRRFLAREGFSGDFEGTITHSQPVNSWYDEVIRGEVRAGWQVQGGTFRLAMIMKHLSGRDDDSLQKRFEFALGHESFFVFGELDEVLGTAESALLPKRSPSNPAGFLRFNPDFVYRYKAVPHLSIAQLERAAVVVAKRVRTMASTASG